MPENPYREELGRIERDLLAEFAAEGVDQVHVVDYVIEAFSVPLRFSVWLGTATDRQRDAIRAAATFRERVREIVLRHGLVTSFEGAQVQSQETVDRTCKGQWYLATR